MSLTRVPTARQAPSAACRHTNERFDTAFHVVGHRSDLTSDAKLLHAHLVSLRRTGKDQTQQEMAAAIGLTRHRVWSGLQELVAADLLQVIRIGLGQPNQYVLLGIADEDLDGSRRPETGVRPVRRAGSGQSGNPARARQPDPKRTTEEGRYSQPTEYLETRYGPLEPAAVERKAIAPRGCQKCGTTTSRHKSWWCYDNLLDS